MAREEERFLTRWSRLKREHATESVDAAKPAAPAPAPRTEEPGAPVLPPVEALSPESDFSVFMSPKVGDALRRAALKKLFRHPEIDVPDPYEPFSGDWTGGEPIPEEMLKTLYQSRRTMLRDAEPKPAEPQPADQAAEAQPQTAAPAEQADGPETEARAPERIDDAGRQDT